VAEFVIFKKVLKKSFLKKHFLVEEIPKKSQEET